MNLSLLKPLHDRVLVKRLQNTENSVHGIVIPESAKKKLNRAEIIAIGNGKRTGTGPHGWNKVPLLVNVGEVVIFGDYAGADVKIDGEDYLILKEEEIYGVVE